MTDEVDFLPNRQRFLQSDTIILDVCGQACPNYPKYKVYYFSSVSLERSELIVDFLHANKHEGLLQTDIIILIGMVKHSQAFLK